MRVRSGGVKASTMLKIFGFPVAAGLLWGVPAALEKAHIIKKPVQVDDSDIDYAEKTCNAEKQARIKSNPDLSKVLDSKDPQAWSLYAQWGDIKTDLKCQEREATKHYNQRVLGGAQPGPT